MFCYARYQKTYKVYKYTPHKKVTEKEKYVWLLHAYLFHSENSFVSLTREGMVLKEKQYISYTFYPIHNPKALEKLICNTSYKLGIHSYIYEMFKIKFSMLMTWCITTWRGWMSLIYLPHIWYPWASISISRTYLLRGKLISIFLQAYYIVIDWACIDCN